MKHKSQEDGVLTLDFIFSSLAIYGISMVFAMLGLSLMMAEVSQYILYASARAQASSHIDEGRQRQMAQRKFDELVNQSRLSFLFVDNEWYKLENLQTIDQPDPASETGRVKFFGVGARYTSQVLDFRVPLLGRTSTGLQDGDAGFFSDMTAFIYREPSVEECLLFNESRWPEIQKLFPELQAPQGGNHGETADNGC